MKVLLSGSTGLIGSTLFNVLAEKGHSVTRLVRSNLQPGIIWNPESGLMTSTPFEGFDAVIHLAGDSIANGRWTPEKKQRIRDSRVRGTKLLADALNRLKQPPAVMICASAIGYYGNRGDEILKESSSSGSDFLAEVCRAWEAACAPAAQKGIRVVTMRFGVILSGLGGALTKMLLPFKLGVGGKIGSGKQYMSWITLDDAVSAIVHVLNVSAINGPVNVVTPRPVTNLDFTRTLGRVLNRPTILPLPGFVARIVLGEIADALLLSSQRVEPAALTASGFSFRYPELEGALRRVLRK